MSTGKFKLFGEKSKADVQAHKSLIELRQLQEAEQRKIKSDINKKSEQAGIEKVRRQGQIVADTKLTQQAKDEIKKANITSLLGQVGELFKENSASGEATLEAINAIKNSKSVNDVFVNLNKYMANNGVIQSDRELFLSQLATKSGNFDINIPQIVEIGKFVEFGPENILLELSPEDRGEVISIGIIAESLGYITPTQQGLPLTELFEVLKKLPNIEVEEILNIYDDTLEQLEIVKQRAFTSGFITQEQYDNINNPYDIQQLLKNLTLEQRNYLENYELIESLEPTESFQFPELTPAQSQIELVEEFETPIPEPEGLAEEQKRQIVQDVVSVNQGNTGPLTKEERDKFDILKERIKENIDLTDKLYDKAVLAGLVPTSRQKEVGLPGKKTKRNILTEFKDTSPRKARILLDIYEKEAYGLYLGGATAIIISESPKKNIQQLSILIGEMFAGNDSNIIKQEISAILDKLLNEGFISSKEHKKLSRFSQ